MKSLARWGALPLFAAPLGAWALSLGEIDVQSALNQPLRAQISLTATADEMQSLNVSLASAESFERYGLSRPAFLTGLEFRVGTDAAGRNAIDVTSRESIAEPFIELLVEVSHRNGRSLRQYTVFLDPPTLLPQSAAPAPIAPAQTRAPESRAPGGAIGRASTPAVVQPSASPRSQPASGASSGGTYGPVQNAETLWSIATALRPAGTTMNQMMVGIYRANPQAFDGNMNVLRRGAILRIPEGSEIAAVQVAAANGEVQRHNDSWQGRTPQQARLILVPPTEAEAGGAEGSAAARAGEGAGEAGTEVADLRDRVVALEAELEESRRLLEVRNEELQALQARLASEPSQEAAPRPAGLASADPGVELESEPLFADEPPVAVEDLGAEPPSAEEAAAEPAATSTAPAAVPAASTASQTVTTPPAERSLVGSLLGWLSAPIVWIVLGAGIVLLGLLLFLRRRRAGVEDVTGQWEALEAEVADDVEREATARMRRQVRDDDFLVHEQHAQAEDDDMSDAVHAASGGRGPASAERGTRAQAELADQTLSSQTVINLDQADPIAEADFHMAYGLYDQAADLVSNALKANPDSRELKLKLLEVFFVWGNKDSFLKSAQMLRSEMGARPDADWDKVIIMGKQICPDESLFADATAAADEVDLDLDAGDAPALDLSFDAEERDEVDLDLGFDTGNAQELDLDATGDRTATSTRAGEDFFGRTGQDDDALDIGERTQAGLEEALLHLDDAASATTPDVDSLAVTQESPTVERPRSGMDDEVDWGAVTMESPTVEAAGPAAATVETQSFDDDNYATVETPTIESRFGLLDGEHGHEEPAGASGEYTAELNLDDLGLDVEDIDGLPHDLGELPAAEEAESDTREQPSYGVDSDLLSATGVTQVLSDDNSDLEHLHTAVLDDDEATMMAPGFESSTMSSTEVIARSSEADDDAEDPLDLNLDDFSSALEGAGDTVEQPRGAFERSIFDDDGSTPIDLDIGDDMRGDEEPTATEEVGPLDPQTMTEVGTKLDLARAYIDMGDPEGARSILEEVLDEGDAGQRREAKSLIDALPA